MLFRRLKNICSVRWVMPQLSLFSYNEPTRKYKLIQTVDTFRLISVISKRLFFIFSVFFKIPTPNYTKEPVAIGIVTGANSGARITSVTVAAIIPAVTETPQWPRLSIHIASIFPPDLIIRHNTVYVKTWEPVWQCFSRKLFLNSQNRMYLPCEAAHLWGGAPTHSWIHPLLQQSAYPAQNQTDTDGIPVPVCCLKI